GGRLAGAARPAADPGGHTGRHPADNPADCRSAGADLPSLALAAVRAGRGRGYLGGLRAAAGTAADAAEPHHPRRRMAVAGPLRGGGHRQLAVRPTDPPQGQARPARTGLRWVCRVTSRPPGVAASTPGRDEHQRVRGVASAAHALHVSPLIELVLTTAGP